MTDPRKTLNAAAFMDLLRETNPHLPPNEMITQDTLTITFGSLEVSALTLTVFVTLPDMTASQLLAAMRDSEVAVEDTAASTAWTLDGQAVTVDVHPLEAQDHGI